MLNSTQQLREAGFYYTRDNPNQLHRVSNVSKQRFCLHPVQRLDLRGVWRDLTLSQISASSSQWDDGSRYVTLSYEDGELSAEVNNSIDQYRIQLDPDPNWVALSSKQAIRSPVQLRQLTYNVLLSSSGDALAPVTTYVFSRTNSPHEILLHFQAVIPEYGLVTFIHDTTNRTVCLMRGDSSDEPINAVILTS